MSHKLKLLILQAETRGYNVFVYPQKKQVRLHGHKLYNYPEATAELQQLLKR